MQQTENTEYQQVYEDLIKALSAVLEGEANRISVMSTLVCLLKQSFSRFYWVGFYLEDENGVLKVGPYQGTLGCLTIEPHRGVCGRAYRTGNIQLVDDVHADPEHIACDAASLSEIVIPVRRSNGSVFGVLDVDSDQPAAFGKVDEKYLGLIVTQFLEPLL
jgi:GAF domain-containing protein